MEIIEKLKSFPWPKYSIHYVLLFGSAVKGRFHDIDLAVRFKEYSFESYVDLLCNLASFLRVREDHLDIVVLNERTPAQLVLEIFKNGVLIYCEDRDFYIEDSLRLINISNDFLRDLKKLKVLETAIKKVMEKWE